MIAESKVLSNQPPKITMCSCCGKVNLSCKLSARSVATWDKRCQEPSRACCLFKFKSSCNVDEFEDYYARLGGAGKLNPPLPTRVPSAYVAFEGNQKSIQKLAAETLTLVFDAFSSCKSLVKRVFDLFHLCHKVGHFNDFFRCASSGQNKFRVFRFMLDQLKNSV